MAVKLLSQFKNELKKATESHYSCLVGEIADIYGYSLFTEDGLSSIGPVANRESTLEKPKSDSMYNYYRYMAVEWSEWDDFGMFDGVNAILTRMHVESPTELEGVLPTCVEVLVQLDNEGAFGQRTDDRFIVICLSDSENEVMMESAKLLNTESAFTAYAGEF